jgi:hypothetical protein
MSRTKKIPEGKAGTPAAYWVAVDECERWVDNPRRNDEAVDDVVRSIRRFGFGAPLIRRKANGRIIAGDTRIQAAKRLGMKTVPVRDMDLTERDAEMLNRADNKTAEKARWDPERLLIQLRKDYDREGAPALEAQGFSEAEYLKMMSEPVIMDLDFSTVRDEFWLNVRGPIPRQADALELLADALRELDGVTVDLGVVKS